ncbi:uncharacterized protein LOC135826275 [Sycon ciliatum]|uniref:uncharacterized protein LOC135826275 n=1 Tax=Sycon ciliatum TaxID=27933 RepID=UPI0031F61539
MEAARFAVKSAPLHFRGLQYLLLDHWPMSGAPTSHQYFPLSPWAQADLQWWCTSSQITFTSAIRVPPVSLTYATDASLLGWGAVCGSHQLGGRWHPDESTHHINWLELRSVQLGLQTFASTAHQISIRLEVDNVPTVAFLNRKGGTRSQPLCQLAQEIWQWAIDRNLELIAVHVPGKENVDADFQSRHFQRSTSDWMLDPELFQELNRCLGPCQVDLFAARHNCQLPTYCSWDRDPWATGIDAFSMPHLWENGYAFPPFRLVGRCLQMARTQQLHRLVLVAPAWPNQPWYPVLLSMLVDYPVQLLSPTVVQGPDNEQHPLRHRLQLTAWVISGSNSKSVAFQRTLPGCGVRHGGLPQIGRMTVPGESGTAGVVNGRLIHFTRLCR